MITFRVAYHGCDRYGQHAVMVCEERVYPDNPGRSGSRTLRFIDADDADHGQRIAQPLKAHGEVKLCKAL